MSSSDVSALVEELRALLGDPGACPPAEARRRLQHVLTRSPPGGVPPGAWPLLDALWSVESATRPRVDANSLPPAAASGWLSRVAFWRGDITTLSVDAIVNAANSGMTGCYQPFHACVDNAIHTAAGPRLREECGRIMAARGVPEPTATATVTRGYFLPARHVVHTVGPIVDGGRPTQAHAGALRRCYLACLEAARDAGLSQLAFCGISTGVFGYPTPLAIPVVLSAVRDFLDENPAFSRVVLVAFSAADHQAYQQALSEVEHG